MTADIRARLLAAGPTLAEEFSLDRLTPERVCSSAGLKVQDFSAAFPSMGHYVEALHQQFLDSILQRLVSGPGLLKPGLERLNEATNLQLDICLEQRRLRALLMEARRKIPLVTEALYKRNLATSLMISIELKSLGCTQAPVIARLYCIMVLETADIEAAAGVTVPAARQALSEFLAHWLPATARNPAG